ncbi:MAG TPA: Mur ligase family protein, partial [Acidimicrobiales bacterium]|nr:Mur ligase family protein [Acidimicrobiales bacterium]
MADALGLRDRVALGAMRAVNAASRATRRGEGTVAGGRVALRLSPRLLERLSDGVELVLVSGTNGKTTTTACLAAATSGTGDVATNATGSNMPPGHVAALGGRGPRRRAILESDEVWLPRVVDVERPRAVVLLNLSRDQLDRTSEVRQLAEGWRGALHGFEGWCVANADDPLVVSAVPEGGRVAWFAGGLAFRDDAAACPRCTAALEHGDGSWACPSCTLRRPVPHATADEHGAVV